MKIPFWKQKTTWTGILGAITSVGSVCVGVVEPYTGVMGFLGSIAAIFLRQGVEKSKPESDQ